MQLEKPSLFSDRRSFIAFTLLLVIFMGIRLGFLYSSYKEFTAKPFYYTEATVLTSYEKVKNKRHYQVLKLRSDEGFTFYTTSHRKENFNNKRLRLQIFPNKSISFQDYLGTFYVRSKIKDQETVAYTLKDRLRNAVEIQHENMALSSFYNAIFFATPIDKVLREKISLLGVSHLVALSGFHLTILWGLVYGFLLLLYRPLQQRYFPYRHALMDVGIVAMITLGVYVWFVDFPPSLVRSYAMVFLGWVVLLLGLELLSFIFLGTVVFGLLALFPSLLVSLSFWFSVAGVFYIFLLLQYTKHVDKRVIAMFVIPIGIFILMLPFVHGIFGVTSGYQLLSPLLSLLFVPFYPFVMFLHLIGVGGMLDSAVLWIFALPTQSTIQLLPSWIVGIYIALSLFSMGSKKIFYTTFGLACLYMVYLFISVQKITEF
ncbi:ComEC/Rec2 family competence protein [Sulfurovum sp.]|uniref:ComEC/Rec2 family competence protein n=1 Tax=Sulfurovum sp. TaxID=1969726 RepID=UPI0028682DF8|nr:ComEC/Rec2 family competence protein [Sulfurovum sp.]